MTEQGTTVLDKGLEGHQLRLPGVKLSIVDGPDRGREVVARRGVVRIGTATDNDLVLTDSAVSRRHLEVRLRSEELIVVDLDSTNGTVVDGVRIKEAMLPSGSLVRVGGSVIRVIPVEDPVVIPLSARERFGGLLGRSVAMREVFAILERVAPTEATVLVEGETGSGKELVAEALHSYSPRADGPFVTIDCGAIAENLMESEIFGHVRGAYTGATSDRQGVFEEAHTGTLLLDEIGELPISLQPKLLRALEKREVRRVGSSEARTVSVRVLAATNRDLAAEVNRGTFREDLYYRLAVCQVRLPSLRQRRDDIPLLIQHFLDMFSPDSPPPSEELIQAYCSRPWPGNVRELRNAVERAVAMAAPSQGAAPQRVVEEGGCHQAMEALFPLPLKEGLEQWTELYARAYLDHVLHLSGGSMTGAAQIAGVNRRYLQRMMKRYNLRGSG